MCCRGSRQCGVERRVGATSQLPVRCLRLQVYQPLGRRGPQVRPPPQRLGASHRDRGRTELSLGLGMSGYNH